MADTWRPTGPQNVLGLGGQTIRPGEPLLILDEIQDCPRAVVALRYFHERMPDLHVVAAGSLLEFTLAKEGLHIPVGRVQYLTMHPLSFDEFLSALGEEPARRAARGSWDRVSEAAHEHAETGAYAGALRIQTAMAQTSRDDFGKYASAAGRGHLDRVFVGAAKMVGRKFMYSRVDADTPTRELRTAVELLEKAGVIRRVRSTSGHRPPLEAEANDRHYRIVFLDVGLMQNICGLSQELLFKDLVQINAGAVAEQFAGQELLANQDPLGRPELYYWIRAARGSAAEVDYLTTAGSHIIPIEVKAGATGPAADLYRAYLGHYTARGGQANGKEQLKDGCLPSSGKLTEYT